MSSNRYEFQHSGVFTPTFCCALENPLAENKQHAVLLIDYLILIYALE